MKKILMINDSVNLLWWAEKMIIDTKEILTNNWQSVEIFWTNDKNQNWFTFFRSFFSFKYFILTLKKIYTYNPDIIHFHNLSRHISVSPIIAWIFFKKIKNIITFHDYLYYCPRTWWINNKNKICEIWFNSKCYYSFCVSNKNWFKNFFFNFLRAIKIGIHRRIIKNYVDIFICPSRMLQESLIKSLKLPKEKVIYLANFIELTEDYRINSTNINERKFLFVWRISKEKWIEVAIRAFDILINHDWINAIYFEIIWDWPERKNLENLTKTLWLENNIKFLWKIDNDKLGTHYESSLAVIVPSIWFEAFGLVNLEAMKYGKPIIWSNVWWIPDLIEDGKNWYLFPLGNHIELAKRIKELYKNTDKSITMWQYGFEKLKREFSEERFYRELMKIYNS